MIFSTWQYFLAIESDLEKTTRYVEISQKNYPTHSIEFARILLSAASEVDVVAKDFCKRIKPDSNHKKIDHYRKTITEKYPKFSSMEVTVPRYGLSLQPWLAWETNEQQHPKWWHSYNKVKHHRNENFEEANLENTLNCVAGLFCLLLYYYQEEYKQDKLYYCPELFSLLEQFTPEFLLVSNEKMDF